MPRLTLETMKQMGQRALQLQANHARYREMLEGHALDAFPDRLDKLVAAVGLMYWYPRPSPEGEDRDYWVHHCSTDQGRESSAHWTEHMYDEENIVARRDLIKQCFPRLHIREQIMLALYYGLLDVNAPTKLVKEKDQYVANRLEVGLPTVRYNCQQGISKLMRLCKFWAYRLPASPLDLSHPALVGIDLFDLSVPLYNRCMRAQIKTLADVEAATAEEFMNIRGFGVSLLTELCTVLKRHGRPLPLGAESYIDVASLPEP